MLYTFLKFISWLACIVPESWGRAIGRILGILTWKLVPQKRKEMAVCNIQKTFNNDYAEAVAMAKASWTQFGPMFIEVLRFPKICPRIREYVEVRGAKHIEEALSYGRGGVIVTSHSGNWELIGAALTAYGMPIAGVAQHQRNESVNRFINYLRAFTGMHITDKLDIREMMKMLGKKYFIGLIMDQDGGGTGLMMQFLGRPASVVQGPAVLSRFKKAPILPVFIRPNPSKPGHHILEIGEVIFTPHTANKDEDIKGTLAFLTRLIEEHIYAYPQQWFWLHNRWKYAENLARERV